MSELALVKSGNGGIITEKAAKLSQEDIQVVRDSVFKDATDSELKLYLHDCQRTGVHPLDRLIHPTIHTDRKTGARRYTAITSIDLFRARAEDTGTYAGNDDPVYSGASMSDAFAAQVTVYKIVSGTRCPFSATARWSEYKPAEGKDFMWTKMPFLMLGKCAEALALRKAFPRQLHGLYTPEEMAQAKATPQEKAAEVEAKATEVVNYFAGRRDQDPATSPPTDSPSGQPATAPKVATPFLSEAQRKMLYARYTKAGKTDEEVKNHLFDVYGIESSKEIPKNLLDTILAWAEDGSTNKAQP